MDILNHKQTTIEDLNLESLPKEVQEKFWEYYYKVPFIRELTKKDRKYAKDLERDEEGKIIVDLEHPHILENMDYFRQTGLHFQKTGRYTDLRPNPNPNSEYGKWIFEEVRRCHEGMVRPSDGEWIPGDLYYFWNFTPMRVADDTVVKKSTRCKKESKKAIRRVSMPSVWDGHYLLFHYLYQAREAGEHATMLSARGKGKSYIGASLLAKRFELGETKYNYRETTCYITAAGSDFLVAGDQTLDKFQRDIDFVAQNTEFPRTRLSNRLNDMQWVAGYKDLDRGNVGVGNAVVGITSKNNSSKLRGTRAVLYILEEAGSFSNLLQVWNNMLPSVEQGQGDKRKVFGQAFAYGCCCAGTKVWAADGSEKNIEDLLLSDGVLAWNGVNTEPDVIKQQINLGKKQCLRLKTSTGRFLDCSIDHPIYKATIHNYRNKINPNKRDRYYEWDFVPAASLKIGDKVGIARHIESWGNAVLFDAYLTGVLIGDGSYGFDNTPKLSNEDVEILDYVKNKYSWSLDRTHITKKGRKYEEIRIKNICKDLRNIGIYGQTKTNKRLPLNYKNLTKEETLKLIAGLIDTDGCVFYSKKNALCYINIVQSSRELLEQVQFLLRKLGATSSITKINPVIKEGRKDKNPWYSLCVHGTTNIKTLENLPLLVSRKKEALHLICNRTLDRKKYYDADNIILDTIIDIQDLGEQEIYNMEVLNNHTYIANEFITHNTAGDSQSDFYAMAEMMYHPEGYHIYALDNIFDLEGTGGGKFSFFFPSYLNNEGCYDNDGNSDVTAALKEILKARYETKKKTSDINAIIKATAENPIVPQEAILRTTHSIFPVAAINERIHQLENNVHEYDDVYVGELVQNPNGVVEFKPSNDSPIRNFPHKDSKIRGALEIYKMPEKDASNNVIANRYIIGHDPVDHDEADSVSLSSTFVLDLFTDSIVAEYTGRRDFAEENYEILRKLCIFYNAKCLYENNIRGCYAYFSKMNSLYMLAETPEYLKDRDIVKRAGYGNTSRGVGATKPVNDYANSLIRDWLLKPRTIVEQDSNGNDIETTVQNVSTVRNLAFLKELSQYCDEGNYDRIRAFGLVMLYREQFHILNGDDFTGRKTLDKDPDYLGNDPFFKKNYDEKLVAMI